MHLQSAKLGSLFFFFTSPFTFDTAKRDRSSLLTAFGPCCRGKGKNDKSLFWSRMQGLPLNRAYRYDTHVNADVCLVGYNADPRIPGAHGLVVDGGEGRGNWGKETRVGCCV
ncbi:hypothetical protein F5Y06DRAFT_172974 [Hypoxylon sp. FL0890]|nr:hypothetical protein F5Y06DRAFT_172974 [Hypoxylon sp. FL0890]